LALQRAVLATFWTVEDHGQVGEGDLTVATALAEMIA